MYCFSFRVSAFGFRSFSIKVPGHGLFYTSAFMSHLADVFRYLTSEPLRGGPLNQKTDT